MCSTWTWVGARRFVACKYSCAALLSPFKDRSYRLSNSFWVRSGDPCSSLTRFSHSSLNKGFFCQRLTVAGSTPSCLAYCSWVRGMRFGAGTSSQLRYFSCCTSRIACSFITSGWVVP